MTVPRETVYTEEPAMIELEDSSVNVLLVRRGCSVTWRTPAPVTLATLELDVTRILSQERILVTVPLVSTEQIVLKISMNATEVNGMFLNF